MDYFCLLLFGDLEACISEELRSSCRTFGNALGTHEPAKATEEKLISDK
jgi:hypothetical protein